MRSPTTDALLLIVMVTLAAGAGCVRTRAPEEHVQERNDLATTQPTRTAPALVSGVWGFPAIAAWSGARGAANEPGVVITDVYEVGPASVMALEPVPPTSVAASTTRPFAAFHLRRSRTLGLRGTAGDSTQYTVALLQSIGEPILFEEAVARLTLTWLQDIDRDRREAAARGMERDATGDGSEIAFASARLSFVRADPAVLHVTSKTVRGRYARRGLQLGLEAAVSRIDALRRQPSTRSTAG